MQHEAADAGLFLLEPRAKSPELLGREEGGGGRGRAAK